MIMKFELSQLIFNEKGLIPAIAQDFESGTVLMLAWMNVESHPADLRDQACYLLVSLS